MSLPIKRILCATDFSATSTSAFHYALAVAEWFDAELAVVHVHRLHAPVAAFSPYAGPEILEPLSASDIERDQLAENLRLFVRTEAPGQRKVTWHLDEATDVPASIVAHAQAVHADLIVLGTHGRSGPIRFILGSTTERVLRTAGCAVLVVPPHAVRIPTTPARLSRVLCATDFSAASTCALTCAMAVARHASATLTVVHVVELPARVPNDTESDLSRYRNSRFHHAREEMQAALEFWSDGAPIHELLLAGRPGPELVRTAREQQVELIVMGVQGRSALDRWLFGSVTQHVVRQAPCAVLTVHPT